MTEAPAGPAPERTAYDPHAVQERWLPVWDRLDLFRAGRREGAPKKYVLDMFPYPSGDLHMGHAEAYGLCDVLARYWMRRGFDVLHPIGWDSFGLPAENAAIRRDEHPATYTYANIETQAESFRRYAISFDWTRRLHTSDPEYYRWTQWLFLRFRERGLAYRKSSAVNWCPQDQTVLANEQVVQGACERCGAQVTKRELTQWFFKVTDYADRLLDDMEQLRGSWPDRVLTMQRNWIGRSQGAHVAFRVGEQDVTVFTTRPDTLYGATFFVVAADAPLALELCPPDRREALEAYRSEVRTLSDIDRQATDRPKTGVDLGVRALNPVTGEHVPVYAADYVLADYGTGAIMAVPAHDQRDLDFARAFGLPVRVVVDTGQPDPAETGVATAGDGVLVNSGPYDGLRKDEAIARIVADLEARGVPARGVHVMSGFRTPRYNRVGGDSSGRAGLSRHMFGDAADIWIDNNGDGQMDDLDGDGRHDIDDARRICDAVDRVERAHPELVGGCGYYPGNGAHGPFTHIDARGYRARWVGSGDGG